MALLSHGHWTDTVIINESLPNPYILSSSALSISSAVVVLSAAVTVVRVVVWRPIVNSGSVLLGRSTRIGFKGVITDDICPSSLLGRGGSSRCVEINQGGWVEEALVVVLIES
jgi:hypothetical protein